MSDPILPVSTVNRGLSTAPTFDAPDALERALGRPFSLRLGANENPFGTGPMARAALREAAGEAHLYGDPTSHELRQALARRLGSASERILVSSGIDDLLGIAVRSLLDPGDVAVASRGTYPMIRFHTMTHGGTLVEVDYRGDACDLGGLADAANATAARLVYLANPDNPTASLARPEDVRELAGALPPKCALLLDEAYVEYTAAEGQLPLADTPANCIRLRTFSKIHGLAGMRIGYAIAPPEIVAEFDKQRIPFGVSRLAQRAAVAAVEDIAFTDRVRRETASGRAVLSTLARELGLETLVSHTNFVCLDLGNAARARAVREALLKRHAVFVRLPWNEPTNRCLRVTVGTADECRRFAEALRSVLGETTPEE